jgi:hypothetical protein
MQISLKFLTSFLKQTHFSLTKLILFFPLLRKIASILEMCFLIQKYPFLICSNVLIGGSFAKNINASIRSKGIKQCIEDY